MSAFSKERTCSSTERHGKEEEETASVTVEHGERKEHGERRAGGGGGNNPCDPIPIEEWDVVREELLSQRL